MKPKTFATIAALAISGTLAFAGISIAVLTSSLFGMSIAAGLVFTGAAILFDFLTLPAI